MQSIGTGSEEGKEERMVVRVGRRWVTVQVLVWAGLTLEGWVTAQRRMGMKKGRTGGRAVR